MVKGHLTGCGLHGYSLAFFPFLTMQSNIFGCFHVTHVHLIPFMTSSGETIQSFSTPAYSYYALHTYIYIHTYPCTQHKSYLVAINDNARSAQYVDRKGIVGRSHGIKKKLDSLSSIRTMARAT